MVGKIKPPECPSYMTHCVPESPKDHAWSRMREHAESGQNTGSPGSCENFQKFYFICC
ncbi:hypothetical protein KAS24_06440 [Candidatus Bathyarchaeota archaeon]|nr:hypothetical protein [Candidatus Bathyarchaeota archaeon]